MTSKIHDTACIWTESIHAWLVLVWIAPPKPMMPVCYSLAKECKIWLERVKMAGRTRYIPAPFPLCSPGLFGANEWVVSAAAATYEHNSRLTFHGEIPVSRNGVTPAQRSLNGKPKVRCGRLACSLTVGPDRTEPFDDLLDLVFLTTMKK